MNDTKRSPTRHSKRSEAYDSFTEHLLSRAIHPGQFISQRELVEITGIPLSAIRELIPRLETDGLITTVPQRGMQIAHIDLDLVRNAFQLRFFLELEAARLFTRQASDETIAKLRKEHEDVLKSAANGITPELLEHAQNVDWSLHDQIIDALDNEIIAKIYKVNSVKIRLIRQERFRLTDKLLQTVMNDHLAIIAAFEKRDPELAADCLRQHLENARGRALGISDR
ncbi:GntR family transcriptional regulator [Thalassospira lucentensis]|uniref:GntR family transcriptional regulator n=1 Tax=Thalassospira lucentensis TaxID=168935 RepID=UPI00142D8673|nr:GntR family transcriptional regulator [Thalassospira lucentensis]NIZ00900.1 GntR family transcriptional regulator [Thalassospira lucentensis]